MLLFTISVSKYEVIPRLRFGTLVFLHSFPRPVVVMDWTVSLPKLICWVSRPHSVMVFGDGATGDVIWTEWGHMGKPWFNGIGSLIRGGRSIWVTLCASVEKKAMWAHREKVDSYRPRREPSPETHHSSSPTDPGFLAFRRVRKWVYAV